MPSVKDIVTADVIRPNFKLFIKRRLVNDTYEADWQRVDVLEGRDTVMDWGAVSYSIDTIPSSNSPGTDIPSLNLKVTNFTGFWNAETKAGSFFYPSGTYLTRAMSKIRVTVALQQDDGKEYAETVMFEGFIEEVKTAENQSATIKCISYVAILKQYSVKDLAFTAVPATASTLLSNILLQSKITQFFNIKSITLKVDPIITDPSALQGDYWQVIQELVQLSASCILFNCAIGGGFIWGQFVWGEMGANWGASPETAKMGLYIRPRDVAGTITWALKGMGNNKADVMDATQYDDEGAGRVVTRWEEDGGTLYAETASSILKSKYKVKPLAVRLDKVASGSRQAVLNALLDVWEDPKPSIRLKCKFLMNYVKVGDNVTYQTYGIQDQKNPPIWGQFTWGEFTWTSPRGSVIFQGDTLFFVTDVSHDFKNLTTDLRLEIA